VLCFVLAAGVSGIFSATHLRSPVSFHRHAHRRTRLSHTGCRLHPELLLPWSRSIRVTAKTVQHGFCATGIELEDAPAAVKVNVASRARAAEKDRSVEIAYRISGHTAFRPSPVRKVAIAVKWIKFRESSCLRDRSSDKEQNAQKYEGRNKKRSDQAVFTPNPVSALRHIHMNISFLLFTRAEVPGQHHHIASAR
jgi:hypothetical protein